MKLAEALAARADAQIRLKELRERIASNARYQEGESPAEDPNALIEEAERTAIELTQLVRRINATNAATPLDGVGTITDAIAQRDGLSVRRRVVTDAAEAASGKSLRFTRSELRLVSALDVAAPRSRSDDLARQRRQLDLRIQAADGATDLVE